MQGSNEWMVRRISSRLSFIRAAAFGGLDEADLDATVRVLRTATDRLEHLLQRGTRP